MSFFNNEYFEFFKLVADWLPIAAIISLGTAFLFTLLWSSIPLMLFLILRRLARIDRSLHKISAQIKQRKLEDEKGIRNNPPEKLKQKFEDQEGGD